MADLVKSSKAGDQAGPQARVGSVIRGKWKVEGLLGVGGMAAVFAATHRNGQRAALKILHADFSREKAICERFLREAYVSNKVNHSATVQVLDDDVTDTGEPFLVMELLEGETVRDAWKKSGKTMPIGRVLQICERVVDCLASCHAIGVIHRDLKPANIFITLEDEIKVLDFGVAQLRDATSERTATGTALGTPAYMSPEQAMGLVDQLDGRADLFSVGAMMHALSTGKRINNGRTEQEALVMAATKPVPSVARLAPNLPIALIKMIDKALAWDRRNRFQDAREMQQAMLELMATEAVAPLAARAPPRPLEVVAPPAPSIVQSPPSIVSTPSGSVGSKVPASTSSVPARANLGSVPSGPPEYVPELEELDPLLAFTPSAPPEAPAAKVSASKAPVATVPESDPRVRNLRDLMKHWDRLLPSIKQLGSNHPATERTLRTCHEAFVEALKLDPGAVQWAIRPYSFQTLGHGVWEPTAPFDEIPYNLFACGMRSLRLLPGITFEEMNELFTLLLKNPARDLPPEDDLAAALWERALPHVKHECADAFAEGDAAEREAFYADADRIEDMAEVAAKNQQNIVEAKAMALSTDGRAVGKAREKSPFALDDKMRATLATNLELTRDAWSQRYIDVLVEGYIDSATHRDVQLVLASLRKSASDMAVAGSLPHAVRLSQAVIERLKERVQGENANKLATALVNAMFGGETLEIVLHRLREDPSSLKDFGVVLSGLAVNELPSVLSNLREVTHPELRTALLAFVERFIAGHENDVAAAAAGSQPETAVAIVQLLAKATTPAARTALASLNQSDDVTVRFESRIMSMPAAQVQTDLTAAIESPQSVVRIAALRASARHSLRAIWPAVSRIVGGKTFNELSSEDRRELLRACIVLSPDKGEPVVLECAKKGGVLVSESRETTRAMAAELLGELSNSRQIASALEELGNARWGASDETKIAARDAAKKIVQRMARRPAS